MSRVKISFGRNSVEVCSKHSLEMTSFDGTRAVIRTDHPKTLQIRTDGDVVVDVQPLTLPRPASDRDMAVVAAITAAVLLITVGLAFAIVP